MGIDHASDVIDPPPALLFHAPYDYHRTWIAPVVFRRLQVTDAVDAGVHEHVAFATHAR